ncbi:PstS family phosphate ABC transporter substrate-binding protein [Desulfitibacter alkalitolerans]|uniref:PstS family phosphate ABC transporter substrate-binding protein n=1 Tax=Desulfitibacter alkalitolerans TaxID=264641 RepID=UPI00054FA654|nr:substrate-binding domain-containing protein [Desulfitibacter alkalitolerans]
MLKYEIIEKTIKALLSIILLMGVGFILAIVTAFSKGQKFYIPLIAIVIGVSIIFVILLIYELVQKKHLMKAFIVFIGLSIIVLAGYEINQRYHDSIATLSDQEVNIYEYMPFVENTRAVSLSEPAFLKITGELPRLDGATALYPLYAAFVQATYPEDEYDPYRSEVMCSKTGEAYKRLINGETDIIFAGPPSKAHMEEAARKGVELTLTPIGREAFVFFVNAENKVEGVSREQIQAIYSGAITNWQQLGGNNESIRAFQRPENSGSQTALQGLMEGKDLMTPPKEDVVAGMGGIIEQTANYRNYKNAIGYSFLYFATEMIQNGDIRLLEIDGVYPDRNTISSGEYPLSSEFYAVTAGSVNPNIELLLEWILSEQGQAIINKTGYTPLS